MAVLLIAEHDNASLKDATHKALTRPPPRWAATCMCWWPATRPARAAAQAAKLAGVKKVLHVESRPRSSARWPNRWPPSS